MTGSACQTLPDTYPGRAMLSHSASQATSEGKSALVNRVKGLLFVNSSSGLLLNINQSLLSGYSESQQLLTELINAELRKEGKPIIS